MRGRQWLLAAGLSVAVVAAGWTSAVSAADTPGQPPGPQSAAMAGLWPGPSPLLSGDSQSPWWSAAGPLEMAASGIQVVARPGAVALVVDGADQVWLHGPSHLARVDPGTGAAEVWDAGDDVSVGRALGVRPSEGSGVWLILSDRIRLFDGRRFLRDLRVPAQYRGGPGGVVTDVVEVGSEIWLSSSAGVARWVAGAWGLVRPEQLADVTALAVDAAGSVWAAGDLGPDGRAKPSVARLEGARWSEPAAQDALGLAEELVADLMGGVLARFGDDVRRFDGDSWQGLPPVDRGEGVGVPRTRSVTVTDDGVTWLLGDDGLARAGNSGWMTLPSADSARLVDMASVGRDVLVTDGSVLFRLRGEVLVPIWSDRSAGPAISGAQPTHGRPVRPTAEPGPISSGAFAAVSRDEVWGLTAERTSPVRFSGGMWRAAAAPPALWRTPVVASDGAVWVGTTQGLLRVTSTGSTLMGSAPVGDGAQPGEDGSVWILPSRWSGWWYADGYPDGPPEFLGLRNVQPDASVTSVPLPFDVLSLTSVAAGAQGGLWVTTCASGSATECSTAPELFRWDRWWAPVAHPGSSIRLIGVDREGSLWATLGQREDPGDGSAPGWVLARYAGGRWSTVLDSGVPERMTLAPGGSVCGVGGPALDLVCVEGSGQVSRTAVGLPGEIGIAPDGSVWLVDRGLVARLPITAPG